MPTRTIAMCCLVSLGMVAGQVLFKIAAELLRSAPSIARAALSPWLAGAIAVYAVTTALWVKILMDAPLARAYVFVLAGAALVPVAGSVILREIVPLTYWLGLIMVLCGLWLTTIQ